MIKRVKYVDPPGGHKFGFPKVIPEDIEDIDLWLIQNGYPNTEVIKWARNFNYVPCQYWYEEIDNVSEDS